MKRIGYLFEQAFTLESLYQAWEDASRGKRGKRATLEFGRNLGANIDALIYLNPLDQYIKRELGARRYCRYVDDFVIFGWSRSRCAAALEKITAYIKNTLRLELSRHTLHKVNRGLNFVGYRTWCSTRFVRKHSLYSFTQAAKRGLLESVISILGHAKQTASFTHLLTTLKAHHAHFNNLSPRR